MVNQNIIKKFWHDLDDNIKHNILENYNNVYDSFLLGNYDDKFKYVLEKLGVDLHRIFINACDSLDLDCVDMSLKMGASPHLCEEGIRTATNLNNKQMVEYFINNYKLSSTYNSCLKIASKYGYIELISLFIENGADVNADYGSPLKLAAINGQLSSVKLLVSKGANKKCSTAMRWARMEGYKNVVEYLQSVS